jgi:HPt (histidine-containing phosphotransfer) domain-containing protein
MNRSAIDPQTFEDLKAATGAEFVAELVATFFEEAPTLLAELREAQAAGAAQRYCRAAHTLKTNAQTFGALALGEQARALELAALPAAPGALLALQAAYALAVADLERLRHG